LFRAGSTGIVDPRDAAKVVFAGSIVQLGVGVSGLEEVAKEAFAAHAPAFPQTSATIRYDVPPEGVDGRTVGDLALQLRYRDGDGRVVATLTEVAVGEGSGQPGTVSERSLLTFDSASGNYGSASNNFRTHRSELGPGDPEAGHQIDFGSNVYYVVLVLSGPEGLVGQPPAMSSIAIVGA
jgi:hypothetical protein